MSSVKLNDEEKRLLCNAWHHFLTITDQRGLLGIVSAKDLMTTADDILIRDLMQTEIISVTTHTDKEEVAQLFTKYDFLAIPVLDQDERMVGGRLYGSEAVQHYELSCK